MKKESSIVNVDDALRLRNDDSFLYESCVDLVTKILNEDRDQKIENALQKACILLSYGIHNVNLLNEKEILKTANSLLTRLKKYCYNIKND